MKYKWKVDIKGEQGKSFEISIVREDNIHGFRSWGWFDEHKMLISYSVHDNCSVEPLVWTHLIELAHKICKQLNEI